MTTLLRTSERTAYARCRQLWWWAYQDKLKPRTDVPALRFGTLIHKALELYCPPGKTVGSGPKPWLTFERVYEEELANVMQRYAFRDNDDQETWYAARELGIAMLKGYVEFFREVDANYRVIASEHRFKVAVRNPATGKIAFYYVGTLDGLWQHKRSKRMLIVDYKTATQIRTDHLALDEQPGSYWSFGVDSLIKRGVIEDATLLDGIMFRFLRKAMRNPDKTYDALGRVLNKDGSLSKVQPAALFLQHPVQRTPYEREHTRLRAKVQAAEMRDARRGKIAVYKEPSAFTCVGCGFREMCELHEAGADWESYRDATMTHWDPYSAHELESEGKE